MTSLTSLKCFWPEAKKMHLDVGVIKPKTVWLLAETSAVDSPDVVLWCLQYLFLAIDCNDIIYRLPYFCTFHTVLLSVVLYCSAPLGHHCCSSSVTIKQRKTTTTRGWAQCRVSLPLCKP